MVEIIDGGITSPQGFRAAGVHSGVKYRSLDLGLLVSDVPATAFKAFTSNKVKAAPVQLMISQDTPRLSAVVVNSGNANALTGRRGLEDAQTMQKAVAAELNLVPTEVGVMSTGLIGRFMDMHKVQYGIGRAVKDLAVGHDADARITEAIMTTDTVKKECAVRVRLKDGTLVYIAAISKGSGMIAPHLKSLHGTTLTMITTDAVLTPAFEKNFQKILDDSMNMATLTAGLTYRAANGTGYDDPVAIDGTYRGLLTNGIAWDDSKIYKISGSTATAKVSDVSVVYALETDGCAFFSVKDNTDAYRFYVLDSEGNTTFCLAGTSTPYVGFQPVGTTGTYMLLAYDSAHNTFKAYRMTSGGIEEEAWFTLNSTNQYAYSTQIPSFYYTKDTREYIVLKCSSYFDRYNITDNEVESIDKGFASNLRTAEITNIKNISGLIFVAGTKSSMLYEIDMENNSSRQL